MPSWGAIIDELAQTADSRGQGDFDAVRRKYLGGLHRHTGRNVISYASGWLQNQDVPSGGMAINDEDIQAFMAISKGLEGDGLDLILHSPGGLADAAKSIVSHLRARFSHIRVIVPNLAMSAATMIACAADEIVLGKHSFLGPAIPHVLFPTPLGVRMVPAQAILDQFDRAQAAGGDSSKLLVWLPMLDQYGPDLIVQCETALKMSKELVGDWLAEWMFKGEPKKAQAVSEWLADHQHLMSYSRHIARKSIEEKGLKVTHLEEDQTLQDLVLSIFHATTHTFSGTDAAKIVESHTGDALVKQIVPDAPPQDAI